MSENVTRESVGNLKISEDVLATVAQFAAQEVEGVAAVTTENKNFSGLLAKAAKQHPVHIELNGDIATVELFLDLYQGASIPDVSLAVQNGVKSAIQNMTGITVSKVDIVVQGIAQPADAAPQS